MNFLKPENPRVPESTSQLIANQEKTGANGGPKFERFQKLFFAELHWVAYRIR